MKKVFISKRYKLQDIAGTKYLAVPPEWIKQHKLKKGDEVLVIANTDLKVLSPESEKKFYDLVQKFKTYKSPPFTKYEDILRNCRPRQISKYWDSLSDAEKEKFKKYCCQKCDITGEEWDDMGWGKFLDLYREKTTNWRAEKG